MKQTISIEKRDKINKIDDAIIDSLLKSEEDIINGRTRKAEEVISELQEKYGF